MPKWQTRNLLAESTQIKNKMYVTVYRQVTVLSVL